MIRYIKITYKKYKCSYYCKIAKANGIILQIIIASKQLNFNYMNKKFNTNINGLVFSTDPNFKLNNDEPIQETLLEAKQKLRIKLETKHRAGKAVTLISGFIGGDADLQDLGKTLKNFCGTGGSAKDGEVIVQGDNRDKILQWLLKNNYKLTKKI